MIINLKSVLSFLSIVTVAVQANDVTPQVFGNVQEGSL